MAQNLSGQRLQLRPEGVVGGSDLKDIALGHRAEIKSGPPHQEGKMVSCYDAVQSGISLLLETGHGVLLSRRHYIQQMVGYAVHLGDSDLSRAQVQAPVDLPGVGGDDLPAVLFREGDSQTALAAGGGAKNDDELGQGHGNTGFP